MLNKKLQGGRSMIEMLGVLAIMAVITVLSIMAYTMAMKNVRTNNFKSDIATIAQQVRGMYPNGGFNDATNGLGVKTFKNLFVDTGLLKSDVTAYGTGVYSLSAVSSNQFMITAAIPDTKTCALLASQNWDGVAKDSAGAPIVSFTGCATAGGNATFTFE